ncbi:MAG: peptidylprolyl isomerase [Acidobacteriota bacterium]|nr:peptidylprolyl isomerase [Acidobacteriota bacterium]
MLAQLSGRAGRHHRGGCAGAQAHRPVGGRHDCNHRPDLEGSGAAAPAVRPGTVPTPAAEPPLPPEKLPAVVAKINGQDVKKDDLLKAAQQMQGSLSQMGQPEPMNAAFYRQVLDAIIARTLIEQAAKSEGVAVTDAEVKAQVDQLKARFPTPDAFKQALEKQKTSEAELLLEARKMFVVQKFIETKITPGITVTDQAAKAFYDQNQDKMKQPERLNLRHILIKVDKTATEADKKKARQKAEQLLAQVKAGGDFAKLATENSDDPGSKAQGGSLQNVTRNMTVEPFEKAAFALTKPNELSPVVESPFGYHIIQLVDRQPEGTVPFDQVKERITGFLKQKQTQEKVQARVQELRSKGKVEVFI